MAPPVVMYMGKDKYESMYNIIWYSCNFPTWFHYKLFAIADEELLKWGFPEDVWYVTLY